MARVQSPDTYPFSPHSAKGNLNCLRRGDPLETPSVPEDQDKIVLNSRLFHQVLVNQHHNRVPGWEHVALLTASLELSAATRLRAIPIEIHANSSTVKYFSVDSSTGETRVGDARLVVADTTHSTVNGVIQYTAREAKRVLDQDKYTSQPEFTTDFASLSQKPQVEVAIGEEDARRAITYRLQTGISNTYTNRLSRYLNLCEIMFRSAHEDQEPNLAQIAEIASKSQGILLRHASLDLAYDFMLGEATEGFNPKSYAFNADTNKISFRDGLVGQVNEDYQSYRSGAEVPYRSVTDYVSPHPAGCFAGFGGKDSLLFALVDRTVKNLRALHDASKSGTQA